MSFFDRLDQWRAEPEPKRRVRTWWLALVITLFIVLLWLLVLRLNNPAPWTSLADIKLRIITGWQSLMKTK